MEGLVPAELRRESDNEQIREEKFIEIIQQLRLKKIIDVQLEILPSGLIIIHLVFRLLAHFSLSFSISFKNVLNLISSSRTSSILFR